MSLCERPTHWLPQNPVSFIINKLLLIIQALLHTMHVLYMRGVRERRRDSGRQGVKKRKRQWGGKTARMRGRVEFAKDLQKKIKKTQKDLGEREERMRPVTCGSHPHPIYLHFIISLISITSHTSFSPFHLLIKVLQLLWAQGKQRESERRWLQR